MSRRPAGALTAVGGSDSGKIVVTLETDERRRHRRAAGQRARDAGSALGRAGLPSDRAAHDSLGRLSHGSHPSRHHQGSGRRHSGRGGRHRPAGRGRQRRDAGRRSPAEMVQGALPLLRHRLRRDGRGQGQPGGRHPRRHPRRGQSRPQLRQGLLPVQDHVRRRPADHAAAAHDGRRVRQGRRVHAGHLGPGVRRHGREVQGRAQGQGPDRRRHVRLRPVDDLGGLRRQQADEGGLPLQQHRPQRAPLHGLGGLRLHAHLRHGRADGLLRRHRGRRRVRALGLEHGRDAPDPVDAGDRPAPVPAAREGRRALDLRAPQLRSGRHPDRVHAADRPGDPQLHRPPHHQDRPRQPGLRRQAHHVPPRQHRHRLRAARRSIRWSRRPRTPRTRRLDGDDASRSSRPSSTPTTDRRSPSCRACPRAGSRRWPSSMPTPRSRSCRSGPWGSTSTRAASGRTRWSTTCTC